VSIVSLFKSSTAGMQFLLRFHRFRRLLNSATAALSSHIDAHTLAGPLGVFCFPQDVVSQASKAYPEVSNYHLLQLISRTQINKADRSNQLMACTSALVTHGFRGHSRSNTDQSGTSNFISIVIRGVDPGVAGVLTP